MQTSDAFESVVFRAEALEDAAGVRAAFADAGFSQQPIASLLGIRHPAETMDIAMVSRRCAEPSPLHTLMRLFILAQAVEEAAARAVFSGRLGDDLLACGLLVRAEGGVRSIANVAPYGDLLCASDFSFASGNVALPADHVLGVGPSSVTLANLTVRQDGGTFYDLGCGSGIQALLAASSAERVVASDLSPRALDFARLNGRINGLGNIEWRSGPFFDPAGEERFDTVACNPPFVVSPSARFIFRDGGMQGDGVSELVARGAGSRLKEGGFASMLMNWIQNSDDEWAERPLGWVKESGCDAWVIRSSDTEPVTYAANWLRQSEARDPEVYERRLQEWIDYYRAAGIERIASGALILRRRSEGPNWQRADVMDGSRASGQCGTHIRKVFACEDFLQQHPADEELLKWRFRLPDNLISDQTQGWNGQEWELKSAVLSLSEGLPFSGRVDRPLLGIVSQCSGGQPMEVIVDQFLAGVPEGKPRVKTAICQVIRQMVRGAMLLPTR